MAVSGFWLVILDTNPYFLSHTKNYPSAKNVNATDIVCRDAEHLGSQWVLQDIFCITWLFVIFIIWFLIFCQNCLKFFSWVYSHYLNSPHFPLFPSAFLSIPCAIWNISLATCFIYQGNEVHWYWQYFSRLFIQHSHLPHLVSACLCNFAAFMCSDIWMCSCWLINWPCFVKHVH